MTSTNPFGKLLATEKISDDGSHRTVGGAFKLPAGAAGMRDDDDDLGARGAQFRRFGDDCRRKGRDTKALHVDGKCRAQRVNRHHADDADLDAGGIDDDRRPDIGPVDDPVREVVNQVRGKERGICLGRARFEGASRVAHEHLARPGGVHRPEVEVVIADGRREVPHGVEGVNDHAPSLRLD